MEEDDDGPTAATEEGDSGSCMVLSGDATLHSCEASRSPNGLGGLEVFGPRKNYSWSTTATKPSFAGRADGLR